MRLIDGDALLRKLKTAKEGSMVAVKHIQEHEVYTAESIALTTFSIVEDVINEVPTIDPVKHGRWEEHGQNAKGDIFRCSNCKVFINPDRADKEIGSLPKTLLYCPNCGARMDGDE